MSFQAEQDRIVRINAYWRARGRRANARMVEVKFIDKAGRPQTRREFQSDIDVRWCSKLPVSAKEVRS